MRNDFESVVCANCGTTFGLLPEVAKHRRDTGQDFTCPNGHVLTYGKGEVSRLRAELEHKATLLRAKEEQLTKALAELAKTSKKRKNK